jgi:hypothetical protein
MRTLFVCLLVLLAACAPVTPAPTQTVDIHATAASSSWLEPLYACADEQGAVLNLTSESPDLRLRLGEEPGWEGPLFQVGTERIVIAASLQSSLTNLTATQANELFSGNVESSAQVWAYAEGEDIQQAFEAALMGGRAVTSYARLAVNPGHMLEALLGDVNAVGFLPESSLTDGLKELYIAGSVPVIIQTDSEPEGVLRELIACMQKGSAALP